MPQTIVLDYNKAEIFLNNGNIKDYKIVKIAGDASFRSYYRVSVGSDNYILMYAPPKYEDIIPFINIAQFLRENKFLAPNIFAHDQDNGFILLEDFGDLTYNRFLSNFNNLGQIESLEIELYKKACDVLIKLYCTKIPENVAKYDSETLLREVMIFIDWYLPFEKKNITSEEKSNFKDLFLNLFTFLSKENQILVLRDYHVDNLMILQDSSTFYLNSNRDLPEFDELSKLDISKTKVGLLDFQDGLIGSAAYDLVSLLEDSRYDISDSQRQKLFNYYLDQIIEVQNNNLFQNTTDKQNFINDYNIINRKILQFNKEQFILDYNILSLQRNIKIIGIFSRLFIRDGKSSYLSLLPILKKYVKARFSEENFTEIKDRNFIKTFLELKNLILKFL
jgi:aminoglycoside/choline kinase family phosphotransferase